MHARLIIVPFALLCLVSVGTLAQTQSAEPPTHILFENVRIFDGKGASTLSAPSNVLVRGNVIAQISTDLIEAEGAQRIAGNGRTLMPGLIDAHWHAAMLVAPTPAEAHGDVGFNNLVAGDEATATLMHGFTGRDSGKQAAWNSNVGGAAGAGRRAASQGQRTSIYHP